jgi:hypothetical protein
MPIKKDKRKKKKITLLKQKQSQTQKVVINLADLVKTRPRAKRLVEPKDKKPSEMILTRIIREPAFIPPYQHSVPEPVKVSHDLEPQQYIPENYKPIVNKDLLEKMGQQPRPFHREVEQQQSSPIPVLEVEPVRERQPRRRQDDPTLIAEKELKALKKRLKEEEMQRRRDNEAELMKRGGYKSQDE